MGGGDVKLAGLLAMFFGWLGWSAVGTASIVTFGLAAAVVLGRRLARRAARGDVLAFGPCMVAGAFVAVLAPR